jgi:bacterioferritin-associated ferredoxin
LGKNKKSTIVCRCWDVTLEEVETAIDQGITDPEELKRVLHVGMGPCQGRTCGKIVNRILIEKTGKPASAVTETKHRPPLVSVPIREILGMKDG